MHASLASIGRACTIEDEEPPETPQNSSIDSQTDYFEQHFIPSVWTAPELVEKTSGLLFPSLSPPSNVIFLWPYSEQATGKLTNETETVVSTDQMGCADATVSTTTRFSLPQEAEIHLDRLSRLHRLCELARRAFQLDAVTSTYTELSSGLANLYTHSDSITLKEYELLEATLSDVSRAYCSPLVAQSNRYSVRPECTSTRAGPSPSSSSTSRASTYFYDQFRKPATVTAATSSSSQLGELRVICESLRQCLTQIKRFFHEQQGTVQLVQQFSLWDGKNCASLFKQQPTLTLIADTNRLTSATILSAHHLVYSGLSLLAHTDITRYTHGDLWEMTRGIEELDILNRHLQTACRTACSDAVCKLLMEQYPHNFYGETSSLLLHELKTRELLYDPVLVACPISVGYLFALIAYQRSIRLSHAIYQQFSAVRNLDKQEPAGSFGATTTVPEYSRLTLVEAFRVYLNQNYDRTASEYLRNEYEFIAGFLDVLSQSTNLLYQVQKLKLLCSAAAAAQTKKAELDRQSHRPRFSEPTTNNEPSNAVSVEGVHGILVKRLSFENESNSSVTKCTKVVKVASKSARCIRKGSATKSAVSQYQDTLHRAGTLDRYVATGSVNCPLSSTSPAEHDQSKHPTEDEFPGSILPTTETKSSSKGGTKKVVQWSDHREISTRHQVIGRFLEMTWRYTETQFNNLFLCPPIVFVASEQASSMCAKKSGSDPSSSEINRQCTTTSCLLMKPAQIQIMAGHIREVAKPDIFPAGLIPVLKRQALRLVEIAHRCRWFTDVRTANHLQKQHPSFLNSQKQLVSVLPTDKSGDIFPAATLVEPILPIGSMSSFFTSADSQSKDRTSQISENIFKSCITDYVRETTMKVKSPQFYAACFPKEVNLLAVSDELTTVIRLSVEIMSHFNKDRRKVESLMQMINAWLQENDISIPYKNAAPLSAELINQPDTMIQSAYDTSRRLNLSTHRLNLHIQALVQRLKDRTVNSLYCYYSSLGLKDDLVAIVPLVGLSVAQCLQFLTLIDLLCFVLKTIVDEIKSGCRRMNRDHVLSTGTCSTDLASYEAETEAEHLVQKCWSPANLQIRLPNGIRLARILATFQRTYMSMKETRSIIVETVNLCTDICSTQFIEHVHNALSVPASMAISSTPIFQRQMFTEKFIRGIFSVVRPCKNEIPAGKNDLSNPGLTEHFRNASSCPFHQIIYKQVLSKMFGYFCSEWFNSIRISAYSDQPTPQMQPDDYAGAVEHLRTLVMGHHQSASIELLAALCDSVEFQRLIDSVSKSPKTVQNMHPKSNFRCPSTEKKSQMQSLECETSQELPAPKDSTTSATFSKPSRVSKVMINTPRAMKDKITSGLNSPGETLAAFAAGVKNTIFIPLRNLTNPETVPCDPPRNVINPDTLSEKVLSVEDNQTNIPQ